MKALIILGSLIGLIIFIFSCQGSSEELQFVDYKNYIRNPCVFMSIPNYVSIHEEKRYTELRTIIEGDTIDIMIAYSIKDSLDPIDNDARIGGMANMIWCSFNEVTIDTCTAPRIWKSVKCGTKSAYYLTANNECSAMISFSAPVDVHTKYRILNSMQLSKNISMGF